MLRKVNASICNSSRRMLLVSLASTLSADRSTRVSRCTSGLNDGQAKSFATIPSFTHGFSKIDSLLKPTHAEHLIPKLTRLGVSLSFFSIRIPFKSKRSYLAKRDLDGELEGVLFISEPLQLLQQAQHVVVCHSQCDLLYHRACELTYCAASIGDDIAQVHQFRMLNPPPSPEVSFFRWLERLVVNQLMTSAAKRYGRAKCPTIGSRHYMMIVQAESGLTYPTVWKAD